MPENRMERMFQSKFLAMSIDDAKEIQREVNILSKGCGPGLSAVQKELTKLPILYITRTAPEKVNENTNLNEKSMIWLTYNKGPNCIEPTNITRLSLRIQKFLKETKSGTIIFDGLEYLTSQNDFSTILHFIQLVNDKIMISDSKLILSINPSAFNPRELAQIERELEPMDNRLLIETQNTSK